MGGLEKLVVVAACALAMTSCAGDPSYQVAAMEASNSGDQKAATGLARKEVARFATADQCSPKATVNCGTLALAYGTLARYQILDGDRTAGEGSFRSAKQALSLTDPEFRAGATGVVYGDVSEAFWKTGDRARAIDVFKEGRTAGADQYLYMTSAARFVDQQRQQSSHQRINSRTRGRRRQAEIQPPLPVPRNRRRPPRGRTLKPRPEPRAREPPGLPFSRLPFSRRPFSRSPLQPTR